MSGEHFNSGDPKDPREAVRYPTHFSVTGLPESFPLSRRWNRQEGPVWVVTVRPPIPLVGGGEPYLPKKNSTAAPAIKQSDILSKNFLGIISGFSCGLSTRSLQFDGSSDGLFGWLETTKKTLCLFYDFNLNFKQQNEIGGSNNQKDSFFYGFKQQGEIGGSNVENLLIPAHPIYGYQSDSAMAATPTSFVAAPRWASRLSPRVAPTCRVPWRHLYSSPLCQVLLRCIMHPTF